MASAVGGCKIVETAELEAQARAATERAGEVNPAAEWNGRVLSYFRDKATPVSILRHALATDGLEGAGAAHGHREGGEGTPFTYVAKIEGTVVEANTGSRAATAGVDTDGDGRVDVTLQLGPVIRGTAIRDALPFVSFTSYQNQIEFAKVAKSFNSRAYETALEPLPRDALVGATISAVGAVTVRRADESLLVTPVLVAIESAS